MPLEMTVERAKRIQDEAIELAGEKLDKSPEVAEVILKQLLRTDPEHLSGLQLMGLAKHKLGRNTEAIEIFQTALELDPYNADNYSNMGIAYGGLGNHERAVENIKKALELEPAKYVFYNNLALQYRALGNREKAIETFKDALKLTNGSPQIWTNMGGVYGEIKDVPKSIECFNNALECDPGYAASHVDLAFGYHLLEDWERGFEEYEWRFEYFSQMQYYKDSYDQSKRWNGKDSLVGKKILIYGEQGLGDIIQFVRWLPELKKLGAHTILHCPPGLDSLMRRCSGVDATFNRDIVNNTGDEFPEYDYQCALMSLPYLLQSFSISGKPYISPTTKAFRKHVDKEYGSDLKIGIVWAGSPSHPHDSRRSIPLKNFYPIYNLPGVKLFSLQFDTRPRKYGYDMRPGSEGRIIDFAEGCKDMKLIDLTTMIQSMEDTATVLAGLDLLIACDTAVVHLAGAMGVPCWMMLHYNCDWRWGLSRKDTVWYDSVRVFRQEIRDDWSHPFESAAKEISENLLSNK